MGKKEKVSNVLRKETLEERKNQRKLSKKTLTDAFEEYLANLE